MADWTTGELRVLRAFHRSGKPRSELYAALPRHTPASVNAVATRERVLLRVDRGPKVQKTEGPQARRMRLANEYFARRAQGHLA